MKNINHKPHTDDNGKGLHMHKSPYLWKENNVAIERDNPTENFVPTPQINTGDESRSATKRIVTIVLLVLLIAFMIYALAANIIENPDWFKARWF